MNMMSNILARPDRPALRAAAVALHGADDALVLAQRVPAAAFPLPTGAEFEGATILPKRTDLAPARTTRQDARALSGAEVELLDREERVAILLSRRSSRLAALSGSWLAALDRKLPALSPQSAEARSRQAALAALRRFAILYRLDRGGLAFEEEDRLARAGYSDAQAEVVRALVERFNQDWSPPAAPWKRTAIWVGLGIAGVFGLDRWLDAGIDDPYVALILSIVMVSAITSFVSVSAHPAGGPGARRG